MEDTEQKIMEQFILWRYLLWLQSSKNKDDSWKKAVLLKETQTGAH